MKKVLPLIIALIVISCNDEQKKNDTNYSSLLEQPITNEKVDGFLKELGSDYEYSDSYGRKVYDYKNKGVELYFTKTDTLKAIFFEIADLSPEIELPLNIKPTDTRKEIEGKFGEPDKYFAGLNNLKAYYLKNDLVVKFKSKDTTNMNNGIENVSVEKLDKEKILGTK